ncbi:MAG: hypothetical protein WA705_16055 [Candidatus Ozemobacteraceae bacterium]
MDEVAGFSFQKGRIFEAFVWGSLAESYGFSSLHEVLAIRFGKKDLSEAQLDEAEKKIAELKKIIPNIQCDWANSDFRRKAF